MKKELKLHKEIIAQLGNPEMNNKRGGTDTETEWSAINTICYFCFSGGACDNTNNICQPPGPYTVIPCEHSMNITQCVGCDTMHNCL